MKSKITAALAVSVLLVVLGVATSFWSLNQMKEADAARKHTHVVIDMANNLLSALKDAETGQLGYLLTGDEHFLGAYLAVRDSIGARLDELHQLTQVGAAHQHLDAMTPLIDARLAELLQVIELRHNHDITAALAIISNGQGERLMDSIRAEMTSFIQIEEDAQTQYEAQYQSNTRLLFILIVGASLVALLCAVVFAWLIYQGTLQRVRNLVHLETQHLLEVQEETNRKLLQAKASLEKSREQLLSFIQNAPVNIAMFDMDMNYLAVSGHWMTEYSRGKDLVGRNHYELYPNMPAEWKVIYQQGLAGATFMNVEDVWTRADGSKIWLRWSLQPWLDEHGAIGGIIISAEDISEHKRAEQVLLDMNTELKTAKADAEKANLAKSVFLSRMSHELRTPLNAILGFAQLLETGSPPLQEVHIKRLQYITKAGWYLLELIKDILDLALIESDKIPLLREPVLLAEVMRECCSMIELQAQQCGIQVNFLPVDESWLVSADRTRLKQVIVNLLSNAIKYNRAQGTVEVVCSCTPERIRINIRDSGEGISPEMQKQLFQPFNRLGKESSTVEGTGIGLVVTKLLIEQMGGRIGVKSTAGVGSEFRVELIRAAPQPADGDILPAALAPQAKEVAALRKLLYVEDNPANLMLVEEIMAEQPGVHMLSARDGNAGIALARTHLPDVILMDINLPGISGVEAMNILRNDPATKHIPIIAISANAMEYDRTKGLEAGFFQYLTKPIKINEFKNALDDALKFSEAR